MNTLLSLEPKDITMANATFDPPSGSFASPGGIPVVLGPTLMRAKVQIITGFMQAGVLIPNNYKIPYHDPRTKGGYQRPPQETRINELVNDLRKGRVDLPTSVLLNVRGRDARRFVQDGMLDLGFLAGERRSHDDGRFFVVDGQHRILALEKLIEEHDADRWSKFPLPFVCMLGATEEEEMDQFWIVNSKAKSVRTDLAFELLRQRASSDPEVMQGLVERGQDWQVLAQEIVQRLADESPAWRGRIRFAAMEKGDTVMPSASMVTSLKPLLSSPYFKLLSIENQVRIVDAFWRGLRTFMMEAFDDPSEFSLQKGVGVIVLHTALVNIIEIVKSKGLPVMEPESYAKLLREPLERLQGDDADGNPVSGLDFWRAAPRGAAGSYSSSAGRRVFISKILQLLPKVEVE